MPKHHILSSVCISAIVILFVALWFGSTQEGFETLSSEFPAKCDNGIVMLAVKDEKPNFACYLSGVASGEVNVDTIFSASTTSFIRVFNPEGYSTTLFDSKNTIVATLPMTGPKIQTPNVYEGPATVVRIVKKKVGDSASTPAPAPVPASEAPAPIAVAIKPQKPTQSPSPPLSQPNKPSAPVPMPLPQTFIRPTFEQCSKYYRCQK